MRLLRQDKGVYKSKFYILQLRLWEFDSRWKKKIAAAFVIPMHMILFLQFLTFILSSSLLFTLYFFRLGIGPDGKPLPIPNTRKLFPCMYPVLVVNQDGSSYNIRHTTPHRIITLPLDPDTLSEEERIVSWLVVVKRGGGKSEGREGKGDNRETLCLGQSSCIIRCGAVPHFCIRS